MVASRPMGIKRRDARGACPERREGLATGILLMYIRSWSQATPVSHPERRTFHRKGCSRRARSVNQCPSGQSVGRFSGRSRSEHMFSSEIGSGFRDCPVLLFISRPLVPILNYRKHALSSRRGKEHGENGVDSRYLEVNLLVIL